MFLQRFYPVSSTYTYLLPFDRTKQALLIDPVPQQRE